MDKPKFKIGVAEQIRQEKKTEIAAAGATLEKVDKATPLFPADVAWYVGVDQGTGDIGFGLLFVDKDGTLHRAMVSAKYVKDLQAHLVETVDQLKRGPQ